jgi:hypothetical protein
LELKIPLVAEAVEEVVVVRGPRGREVASRSTIS